MFEQFLKGAFGLRGKQALFTQYQLGPFKPFQPCLQSLGNGLAAGIDNTVHQSRNLLIERGNLALAVARQRFGLGDSLIPCVLEHGSRQFKQLGRWRELPQQRLEVIFHRRTADGFAMTLAARLVAHIVWMARTIATARPIAGQRMPAAMAGDNPPQREFLTNIGPRRRTSALFQAILDALEGLEADKSLMPALA